MMKRRQFIIQSGAAAMCSALPFSWIKEKEEPVYGHNNKKYKWDEKWTLYDEKTGKAPNVKDCHEMVCLRNGEMILLTNHPENNIIRFNPDGKVTFSGCQSFPGAHGLTLGYENEEPFLVITDTDLHKVFITDLEGNIKKTFSAPIDGVKYLSDKEFVPTETTIADNGDIYIADGYGKQYILHYNSEGELLNIFGGRGDKDENLDNAHGICVDRRSTTPQLIVTDRNKCCFKRFSLDGQYLSTIPLPGANVCRPVIDDRHLYAAVLTTNHTGNANTGFVVILDEKDRLISCVGGSIPEYKNNVPVPSYQTVRLFKHPHDVMIDQQGNLYVCQWNSGQVLPYKFIPA